MKDEQIKTILKEIDTEELKIFFKGLFVSLDTFKNLTDLKLYHLIGKELIKRGIDFDFELNYKKMKGNLIFKGEK